MEETFQPGRRRRVTKDLDRLSILCEVNPLGLDTPSIFSVNCHFFIDEQPTDSYPLVLDLNKERRSLAYPFHRKLYVSVHEKMFHAKGNLRLSCDEEGNPVLTIDVAFWYGRDFDEPPPSGRNYILINVGDFADERNDDTTEGMGGAT